MSRLECTSADLERLMGLTASQPSIADFGIHLPCHAVFAVCKTNVNDPVEFSLLEMHHRKRDATVAKDSTTQEQFGGAAPPPVIIVEATFRDLARNRLKHPNWPHPNTYVPPEVYAQAFQDMLWYMNHESFA